MKPLAPLSVPLTGRHLIEASAGTGKTFTITTLVLRLVVERDMGIERVLVVTFTKAATAELRSRVRTRLRDALDHLDGVVDDPSLRELLARVEPQVARRRVARALSDFDLAAIFTIHGFCQRVLSEHAFESGARFGLDLLTDTSQLLLDATRDEYVRALSAAPPSVAREARRHLRVADLSALVRTATSSPDTLVQTDAAGPDPSAVEEYLAARAAFALEFPGHAPTLRGLLLQPGVLSQQSYKAARVDLALAEAERLVGARGKAVDKLEVLHILSPDALERGTNKGHSTPRHPVLSCIGRLVSAHAVAQSDLDAQLCHLQVELVAKVTAGLHAAKERLSVRSFDDLLLGLREALRAPGETLSAQLRKRYPVALVDEFQDTDPVQYEILSRVYAEDATTLFMIGDPKQAIYAFRGADVFSYLKASRNVGKNRYGLTTSYRADPSLVHAQNVLYEGVAAPFVDPAIAYAPITPRPEAVDLLGFEARTRPALDVAFIERAESDNNKPLHKGVVDAELSARVAVDIADLLASKARLGKVALRPADIAVLTRTNKQAAEMQAALSKIGIPAVLVGDRSVFESAEASELALVMRALAEPARSVSVRSALFMPCLGFDAAKLRELESSDALWEEWASRFARLSEVWKTRGFIHAFHKLMREGEVTQRLLSYGDGERKLTNLLHLAELLHQVAVDQHLGIAGLLRYFDEAMDDGTAREALAPEAQQLRLESDAAAVSVTTVHKSKGLEYPIVYLPHLWIGDTLHDPQRLRFHDAKRGGAMVMHIARRREKDAEPCPERARAEEENLAEAMRVGYVALTRARHHTVSVFGAIKTAGASSLGRLLLTRGAHRGASATQRLRGLDDRGLRSVLDALGHESGGKIGWRGLASAQQVPKLPEPSNRISLQARRLSRRLGFQRRTSSFTALTRGAEASHATAPEHDHDASLGTETTAEAPTSTPVVLADFPRGARAGECLHRVFELIDFVSPDTEARGRIVERVVAEFGIDPKLHAESVKRCVADVLSTSLHPQHAVRLGQVSVSARRSELEFVFPVRADGTAMTPAALGSVLTQHAASSQIAGYGASVSALGFLPLAGALRGFIDLVFQHEGKFYLVDYKSNFLGTTPDAYAAAALQAEMLRHHYVLQYHLYAVALHRFLAVRVPDYAYDRHFGGVAYLFLRGMQPDRPGSGVFFDLPTRSMIEALSAVLEQRESTP